MAYEQKDNSGALFKNKKKDSDKHPDYTGIVMVGGVEYWISAWINTPKAGGDKYMSLNFNPKEQQVKPAGNPGFDDPTGDIPF